jgi:uncharacterized protein (DUF362 family)
LHRRTFLKGIGGYGIASLAIGKPAFSNSGPAPGYIGLHPFIEAHPEAVFIRRTALQSKGDAEGKKSAASALARQIFTLRDTPGIPLTHKFAIKPNLTSAKNTGLTHAIVTDPYVVEGIVEGLKHLGVAAPSIFVREGLSVKQNGVGFVEMSQRTGVHYDDQELREHTTRECPDGVVFRRTKYLGPFSYPDSWLLNISKLKTHQMGLTLCVKNLQGTNIPPYIRFCGGLLPSIARDFQPDAADHVDDLYNRHREAGFVRWETEKGPWMEMWIQRTIDSYRLIQPTIGLNIIDGIYAQNGDGFDGGPGRDGIPESFLTNMLIFGKDAFRVDIIGHWLGGHEPGNFGLFHIAKERGVSTALDPANIPVYVWEDAGPRLTPLGNLTRTPLRTPYLDRVGEPHFHLCDEPFSYGHEKKSACLSGGGKPDIQVLGTARSSRRSLVIEYRIDAEGNALVDVWNPGGERVEVLAEGLTRQGIHAANWNLQRTPPGNYWCRLRTAGATVLRPISIA